MNKLSDLSLKLLRGFVLVALMILFFSSERLMAFQSMDIFEITVNVMMLLALALCIVTLALKVSDKTKICIILSLAFVIRVIWCVMIKTLPVSDFATMYESAKAVSNGDFSTLNGFNYFGRFPHMTPMVLYISVMIKLFGANALGVMKCVSVLLSVLSVYLVYVLSAFFVKNEKSRLIAMTIAAVCPSLVSYCSTICSENIGIPLYLLTTIIFFKAQNRADKKWVWFLLSGGLLYMSNMFRGIALIFLIAFSLYILLCVESDKIKNMISVIAGYCILATVISGLLIGTGVLEKPLWKGSEPAVATMVLKGSNYESTGMWNAEDANFTTDHLGEPDLAKQCFEIAGKRIMERTIAENTIFYLGKFVAQWAAGDCSGTFWATAKTTTGEGNIKAQPIVFQLIFVIMVILSFFAVKSRRDNKPLSLLYLLLCGFGAMFLVIEIQARYSFAMSWIFIILSACGLDSLMHNEQIKTSSDNRVFKYFIFEAVVFFAWDLIFNILRWKLPWPKNIVISSLIAIVIMYVLIKNFAFSHRCKSKYELIGEALLFVVLEAIIALCLYFVSEYVLNVKNIDSQFFYIARISVVRGVMAVLGYLVSKYIVFRKHSV